MSTVLIPLLAAAYLAAYFWIGWRLTVASLPVAWTDARRTWEMKEHQRSFVRDRMTHTIFFWPFTLTAGMVRRKLDEAAADADPAALAARVREQDARIAQLERELGIGQDR